jgi:signal transduction histidine kinase
VSGGERGARWGTRARLTALIAAVLVGGGALLLGSQYLVVQQVLVSADGRMTADSAESAESAAGAMADQATEPDQTTEPDQETEPDDVDLQAGEPTATESASPSALPLEESSDGSQRDTADSAPRLTAEAPASASDETSDETLTDQVLPRIALWSALALAVFSGLAILAARWLSRRSFRRVAQITDLAQRITAGDLDERIDLGGRRDEVRELADTIDGMLDRLQGAFARQERFVANASHELRTPLTTTRTALEIPLAQGRIPEDLEPAFHRALAANAKSERLIAALLALAQVRHGDGQGDPDEENDAPDTDLTAVVAAALETQSARTAELRATVDCEVREALPVRVDSALLELAVGNLIGNAVRHNVPEGLVRVSAGVSHGEVRLRIENTGAQLDEHTLTTITEPFNRGDTTRLSGGPSDPGLGLGLTLADEAARAWGGSLALSCRPGGGLIAVLHLPRPASTQTAPPERVGVTGTVES